MMPYKNSSFKWQSMLVTVFCSDPCYENPQSIQPNDWSRGDDDWQNHLNADSATVLRALQIHKMKKQVLTMDLRAAAYQMYGSNALNRAKYYYHNKLNQSAVLGIYSVSSLYWRR